MTNSSKLYLVNINFWPNILIWIIDILNLCEQIVSHKALTCPWTNMVLWRGQMGTPSDLVDLVAESRWKVDMAWAPTPPGMLGWQDANILNLHNLHWQSWGWGGWFQVNSEPIHFLRFRPKRPLGPARREATSEGFRRALVWHLGPSRSHSRGWVTCCFFQFFAWGPANTLWSWGLLNFEIFLCRLSFARNNITVQGYMSFQACRGRVYIHSSQQGMKQRVLKIQLSCY